MTSDDKLRGMLRAIDAEDRDGHLGVERGEALRDRIIANARRTLAARHRRTVWDYSARWARAAVPVGIAASILAAGLLLRAPDDASMRDRELSVAAESGDNVHTVMRSVAYGEAGSAEMLDSLVGPATRDALYTRVLGGVQ
jgi:hypothetical protein